MLACTFLLAALAAGTPFLTPGTFTYAATLNGARTGSSTLTVTRDGSATEVAERASGTIDGMQLAAQATLTVGADLAPTAYNGSYHSGAMATTVTAALTADSATVINSQTGGTPQTLSLTGGAQHFVVIEPGLIAGLFALPAEMEAWNDAPVLAVAPSYARGQEIAVEKSASPVRPAGVPAGDAVLAIGGRLPFTIWYDPATFVPDQIAVPSQDAVITRVRQ
jgi:hypothetical protein